MIWAMTEQAVCFVCLVCMDEPLNRFQMMAKTHPQLYNYCIHKLELNKVLDFLKNRI